jgi:hypothetical protein
MRKRREGMSFLLRLLATPTEDEFFYCLRSKQKNESSVGMQANKKENKVLPFVSS